MSMLTDSGKCIVDANSKCLEERKERIRQEELNRIINKRKLLEAESVLNKKWSSTMHRINEF